MNFLKYSCALPRRKFYFFPLIKMLLEGPEGQKEEEGEGKGRIFSPNACNGQEPHVGGWDSMCISRKLDFGVELVL